MTENINALNIRVWYVEGGVHPSRAPEMLALGKFGDPSHSHGDETRIAAPDPNNFTRDVQVGSVSGSVERATLSVSTRYLATKAELLRLFRKKCRVDWYALIGKCGDPQNFTQGGEKWMYFPDGKFSQHSMENFGAYSTDENNPTNENTDLSAEEYWEFLLESFTTLAGAVTTREVRTVDVCDDSSCGDCDRQSDGCDRVLATMLGTAATPGTVPVLLYSDDNGATWSSQNIDTMFSNENISGAHCIGGDLVVITNTGNELHYTSVNELYLGTNTWNQADSGFVVGGEPQAIWSVDVRHTWIVGNGGYVYFTKNHATGVTVQDAGVATTQNLNDVHASDTKHALAVGNSNAVVYTTNGGETWQSVTGPSVGVALGACWMWDQDTWLVGEGSGGTGVLYLTTNQGVTWTTISLPVSIATGQIYRIKFVSPAEGYISATTGSAAVLFRTITGGNEWVALPDGLGGAAIPDADYLLDIAVCEKDSNTVFGAGLAGNGTAGIIIKAEG